MRSISSTLRLSFLATALLVPAACSDSPGPGRDDDPLRMAEMFDAIADSLGDVGMQPYANAYSYVGHLIRLAEGVSKVTLDVDGAAKPYYAIGEQYETYYWSCSYAESDSLIVNGDTVVTGGSTSPTPQDCELVPYITNTFYAWEPDSVWRLVRIMADTGYSEVRQWWNDSVATGLEGPVARTDIVAPNASVVSDTGSATPVEPIYVPMLWAELMDNEGRFWWANAGSQTNRLLSTHGDCPMAPYDSTSLALWIPVECTKATFTYSHQLRFDPPPSYVMSPLPAGEDTVRYTMAAQSVVGVIIRMDTTGWIPPDSFPVDTVIVDTIPPDTTSPGEVRVYTYGWRDSVLTETANLKLTIMNSTADTVVFEFPTTQQFDFVVTDSATGQQVWRWSDGQTFAQTPTRITIPPSGGTQFTVQWPYGSRRGYYLIEARIPASNLPMVGFGPLWIP